MGFVFNKRHQFIGGSLNKGVCNKSANISIRGTPKVSTRYRLSRRDRAFLKQLGLRARI